MVVDQKAALPDRRLVAGDEQLGFAGIEGIGSGEAGGVLAAPVEDRLGAAISQQIASVADALHDQRDRNIVDHQFEEFLGTLQFMRKRAAVGDVVEQRDQELPLVLVVARDDAHARENPPFRAPLDLEFGANLAVALVAPPLVPPSLPLPCLWSD